MNRISVDNGKYTVVMQDEGGMYAERYGERWRDLTGDKLVFNLCHDLMESRLFVDSYRTALQQIANGHPNPQQFAKTLLSIG